MTLNETQSMDNAKKTPLYKEMVKEAILYLNERNGSSRQAILKYIRNNFDINSTGKRMENHVKMTLVRGVTCGHFQQTKGVGANGSFKVIKKEQNSKRKDKSDSKTDSKETKPATKKTKPTAKETKKQPEIKGKSKQKGKLISPKKPKKTKKPKDSEDLETPVKNKTKKMKDGNLIKKNGIKKLLTPKKVAFTPKRPRKPRTKLADSKNI
ncbi:histone H1.0-B-like [Argonauta hians]